MKICNKCKLDLPLERFSKCKASKDGLAYSCKGCQKEWTDLWRQKIGGQPLYKQMTNIKVNKWLTLNSFNRVMTNRLSRDLRYRSADEILQRITKILENLTQQKNRNEPQNHNHH